MSDQSISETDGTPGIEEFGDDLKEKEVIKASPDSLLKDTVHCFPANRNTIMLRRILTAVLGIGFIASSVYFFLPASRSIGLSGFSIAGAIICILVFVQTFLIASYRVALDYTINEVVLRYQFTKIRIPFEDFDTREGKPDQASSLLTTLQKSSSKPPVKYLILDNVRESACYQTTSKDLASPEDFDQLESEAKKIRDVYRGIPDAPPALIDEDDEMARIINSAMSDNPKNIDE